MGRLSQGEFLGSNGLLLIYKSTLAVALVNQIESGTTLVQDDGMSLENSDNVNYLLVSYVGAYTRCLVREAFAA